MYKLINNGSYMVMLNEGSLFHYITFNSYTLLNVYLLTD